MLNINESGYYYVEEDGYLDELQQECETFEGEIAAKKVQIAIYNSYLEREGTGDAAKHIKSKISALRKDIREIKAMLEYNTMLIVG